MKRTTALFALLHYFVLFFGPLIVVFVIFAFLEGNNAEYSRQSFGIKIGGPIAAYVVLFMFFRRALNPMWSTYSELLRRNDLTNGQAIALAQDYAVLIGRYVYVQLLWLEQRGYFPRYLPNVLTEARKSMYGFQNLVGPSTIHEGKYKLAEILGAAINNPVFFESFKNKIEELSQSGPLKEKDIELSWKALANLVWKECENAIVDPNAVLQRKWGTP